MKGVYLIIFSIPDSTEISVGSLGVLQFEKGTYAYVGSAQRNLEKRILRHLNTVKKRFWHIDYLLSEKTIKVSKILIKGGKKEEECLMGKIINKTEEAISNFGSSDCKCNSHLFKITDTRFIHDLLSIEESSSRSK